MSNDTALLEKREDIKRQLTDGTYRSLIDMYLSSVGRVIQMLLRTPDQPSYIYNMAVISLITMLISYVTSLLLNEFYAARIEAIPAGIALTGLSAAGLIAVKIYIDTLFNNLRDDLLDAIEAVVDLADFQQWLISVFDVKKQLLFSVAFAIIFTVYGVISYAAISGGFVGIGGIIGVTIVNFQGGMMVYFLFPAIGLPVRLSRYQYQLYLADPSSSEVIDRLAEMLNSFVYVTAALVAISSLIFALLNVLILANIIIVIILFWVPPTAFFITNQYALARIIGRAKWKKLNEIQGKIIRLEAEEDIPGEKTLDHLNKLMNYHDRIKATPNSALNLRAGLNFLNSLLLPVLAFLLGNLDKVLAFFS